MDREKDLANRTFNEKIQSAQINGNGDAGTTIAGTSSNGVTGFLGNVAGSAIQATGLSPAIGRLAGLLRKGGKEEAAGPVMPNTAFTDDFRVKIKIPVLYLQGPAQRLQEIGDNAVVFPYTPQIVLQARANYTPIHPTHSNYAFYAYQNSQIDAISIVGSFTAQNQGDAKTVMGAIHALRTVTKMHFGSSDFAGAPPPVCRLHGYGDYVFNNMPVVISSFFYTMNDDVDYIATEIDGANVMVPSRSEFTVECLPAFSRRDQATWSINAFAKGGLKGKGFI